MASSQGVVELSIGPVAVRVEVDSDGAVPQEGVLQGRHCQRRFENEKGEGGGVPEARYPAGISKCADRAVVGFVHRC